jgi:long-chain fatty acid transport protein
MHHNNKNILIVLLLLHVQLFAGGYQVNLQGNRQLGMGHCGIGLLRGSSTVFFNPGGLSLLEKNSFSVGTSLVFANTLYQEPSPGLYQTNTLPNLGTPVYLYANFKLKEDSKLAFGLSVNTPFGSTIEYEDNWLGQALMQKMSLKAFFIQPTISYKINDKVGIGAGFVYGAGSFSIEKAVPVQDQNGDYGKGTLSGKANGYGYNVGVFIHATDQLTVGLTCRSKVLVGTDKGNANFEVASSLEEYFPSTTFSTKLKMPGVYNLGLGYKVNDKISFALDLNYVTWGVYDSLSFDFVDNTEKLEDIASPRNYKNTFIYRFGAEYKINDMFTGRCGAYFDTSPVQDGYVTPETPGSDKTGLTAGVSITFGKFDVDLSYLYAFGQQRTDINLETGFGGTWKSSANIIGLGVEYRF